MNAIAIEWTDSLAAYRQKTESGAIAVLMPPERERAGRWEKTLRGYIDHGTGQGERRSEDRAANGEHLVLSLDPPLRAVAEAFATARNRRLFDCQSLNDVLAFIPHNSVGSLSIFGERQRFSAGTLAQLNALEVPYGIFTGRDIPAISFLVAKVLASPARPPSSTLLIDALSSVVLSRRDFGGRFVEEGLNRTTIEKVASRPWQTLGMVCHGEGAHLKLGQNVGCGAVATERHNDGSELQACIEGEACKRSRDGLLSTLPLVRLVAENVWLGSCYGVSVAGETYPSDNSAVLALLEGHARSVIAAIGIIQLHPWLTRLSLQLLDSGVGHGEIAKICNDLVLPSTRFRPFVCFGDPVGTQPAHASLSADGRILTKRTVKLGQALVSVMGPIGSRGDAQTGAVVVFPLNTPWAEARCLRVAAGTSDTLLVKGTTLGAVIPGSEPITLSDCSRDLDRAEAFVQEIAKRLHSARALEDWFRCHWEGANSRDTDLSWLEKLTRARLDVEQETARAQSVVGEIARLGVFSAGLVHTTDALARAVAAWDECLAKIVDEEIYAKDSVYVTTDQWADPLRKTYSESSIRCCHCDKPLRETTLTPWGMPSVGWKRQSCITHEMHYFYPLDAAPMELQVGKPIAGVTVPLHVKLSGSPDLQGGWLVAAAHDNGRGVRYFRHCNPVGAGHELSLRAQVPHDARPDIHVYRAALVQNLHLYLARRATPLAMSKRDHG